MSVISQSRLAIPSYKEGGKKREGEKRERKRKRERGEYLAGKFYM